MKQRGELSREYGLKIIEYDTTNSSHITEIRKILTEITEEDSKEISKS